MPDATQENRIVVGFDGSDGSRAALNWATKEAQLRGARLEVVRAWAPGEFGTDQEIADYTQTHLQKELSELLDGQEVRWNAVAERGAAGDVLLERAAGAQMVVVGSRGHGTLSGLLLGSVSSHVATHPGAAVVVIVKSH